MKFDFGRYLLLKNSKLIKIIKFVGACLTVAQNEQHTCFTLSLISKMEKIINRNNNLSLTEDC
jgi:hypothetical protein